MANNNEADINRLELDLDYQRKAALLQKQNTAYNEYCEQNGLNKLRDRIDVARWDRKQAAAARGAAKRYKTTVADAKERRERKKNDLGVFSTLDNRTKAQGTDVIKPKNIINEMQKSEIGKQMLAFLNDNDIPVRIYYGVDVPENGTGLYFEGAIHIYADNTKTIEDTALATIHESTHAKINAPNTKKQEVECFKNEYKHLGILLTDEVVKAIIKMVNENCKDLP